MSSGWRYDAFVAWAAHQARKWYEATGEQSRTMPRTAAVLCRLHKHAVARRSMPYLTITYVAARAGAQNRDATRRDLLLLASFPGSPFVLMPYNDRTHVWRFHIVWGGGWMSEAKKGMNKAVARPLSTITDYQAKRQRHRVRVSVAKWRRDVEAAQQFAKLKRLAAQARAEEEAREMRANLSPEDRQRYAALEARLDAKRRQLGILKD